MKLAGDRAHERVISVSTYSAGECHIVVEGRLIDDRTKEHFLISGEKRGAGRIHNLVIRLLVRVPQMLIEDIEVEMQDYPRTECLEMEKSMDCVKGLSFIKGFTANVKSMLSGAKGCTHLVHLLITMAPAVMQGYWALKAQEPLSVDLSVEEKHRISRTGKTLMNTCYVWREDGEAYRKFNDVIKKLGVK